ncbi:MAG: Slp family lipoprotein [Acidiferrobacteraceae bacterium]
MMRPQARYGLLLGASLIALAGCASMPRVLRNRSVDAALQPAMVMRRPAKWIGHEVRWGGTIIRTENRRRSTRVELLAYPLDATGRPKLRAMPYGRFYVEVPGYLEPVIYRRGRALTVVGRVKGVVRGHIGRAPYVFPDVAGQALHLWPRRRRSGSGFGIGIGIGVGA